MANKIPYRLQTDEHKHYYAPAGERIEVRHRAEMDANGRRKLVPDVKVNIWDMIQSHAEECEIENIIRRALNGDPFALNKKNGNYMDITEMPKSIAEAQQLVINLKLQFDKLPLEIKNKFENNPELYIAQYGTDYWAEATGRKEEAQRIQEAEAKQAKFSANMAKAMENLANTKEVATNE